MINKSKASGAILCVSLLAFILFVVYILYINQEMFYFRSDAVCGSMAHTVFLSSCLRYRYAGCYLGTYILCGYQSIPVTGKRLCADALACCLPACLCCRFRLLGLYLSNQRLLVLAIGGLSRHVAALVGSPLHPTQMAYCLVSVCLQHLSSTWVVCLAFYFMSCLC